METQTIRELIESANKHHDEFPNIVWHVADTVVGLAVVSESYFVKRPNLKSLYNTVDRNYRGMSIK